jgi:hypothetical protein
MDPELIMVVLAQDLTLYRNLTKLNDRLMDASELKSSEK